MKLSVTLRAAVLAAALITFSTAAALQAQTLLYRAVPNASKLRMDGDSTIHRWAVETTLIGGTMELPADFPLDPSKPMPAAVSALPKVQANILVDQLHNNKKSETMDDRMKQELKSSEHPQIRYRLTEMKPGKEKPPPDNWDEVF